MVSYKTLIQVIDDNVNKCSDNKIPSSPNSWGVRFNKNIRKTFDDFHYETCGLKPFKKEKAIVVDENGNVLYSKMGDSHSVSLNEDKIWKLRNENGYLHFNHNHPSQLPNGIPTMFSKEDARTLIELSTYDDSRFHGTYVDYDYTYKSISAESPNGSRITLIRKDDYTIDNDTDYINTYSDMEREWQNYLQDFRSEKEHMMAYYNSEAEDGWFHKKYNLKGKTKEEQMQIIDDEIIKEIGTFEEKIAPYRERFNKCNVELSIEWLK